MDLDALLASVDAPASPQPTKRSGSGECDACIDLDKLLAPAGAEATPAPAPEAPASPTPSPDPAPEPSADQSADRPGRGTGCRRNSGARASPTLHALDSGGSHAGGRCAGSGS